MEEGAAAKAVGDTRNVENSSYSVELDIEYICIFITRAVFRRALFSSTLLSSTLTLPSIHVCHR